MDAQWLKRWMKKEMLQESKGMYRPSGQAESRTVVKMKTGRERTVLRGKDTSPPIVPDGHRQG